MRIESTEELRRWRSGPGTGVFAIWCSSRHGHDQRAHCPNGFAGRAPANATHCASGRCHPCDDSPSGHRRQCGVEGCGAPVPRLAGGQLRRADLARCASHLRDRDDRLWLPCCTHVTVRQAMSRRCRGAPAAGAVADFPADGQPACRPSRTACSAPLATSRRAVKCRPARGRSTAADWRTTLRTRDLAPGIMRKESRARKRRCLRPSSVS